MTFIELALWRAFLIALGIWGIVTAVALLRSRPRARHSAVLFSFVSLVVVAGVLYLVSSAVAEVDANRRAFELLLLALVPLWWLILFTRPSVRRQFDSPPSHRPPMPS